MTSDEQSELVIKYHDILDDNKIFRYGREKRPLLPHERREHRLSKGKKSWILTDFGDEKAKKLFGDMFPEDADYPEDTGLMEY